MKIGEVGLQISVYIIMSAVCVQFLFFVYIFSDIEEYEKRIKVLEQECAEMKAAGKTEFGIGKLRKKYLFWSY